MSPDQNKKKLIDHCAYRLDWVVADTQVVAHVLRAAGVGGGAAGVARGAAAPPPPHPPRGAARDLLLHHHWLAQLATGKAPFLVHPRNHY